MSDPNPKAGAWRRFEQSGRYWQIRVRGRRCELRFGALGEGEREAESERREFEYGNPADARRQLRRRVRSKLRAGWLEVPARADERGELLDRGETLEADLAASLDDPERWLVYADFLQQIDPLLGERLALGLAQRRSRDPELRAQLEARARTLEREHGRELLGPTLHSALANAKLAGSVELERRDGLILGARLRDVDGRPQYLSNLIEALLALPAARLLQTLVIHCYRQDRLVDALGQLIAAPRPTLRALVVDGTGEASHPLSSPRLPRPPWRRDHPLPTPAQLLAGLPALETLGLYGDFDLGELAHPQLRELNLWHPGVSHQKPWRPTSWALPELHSLRLLESEARVRWTPEGLAKLRRLLVDANDHGVAELRRLASCPELVERLEILVVTRSHIHDAQLPRLLELAPRFSGLRRLVLHDVVFGQAASEALQATLPAARVRPWLPNDPDPAELAAIMNFDWPPL